MPAYIVRIHNERSGHQDMGPFHDYKRARRLAADVRAGDRHNKRKRRVEIRKGGGGAFG
jgi:hypothetical protein